MNPKNFLARNLKNAFGWSTKRKIVVFEVDDYGAVRVESKQARDRLIAKGLRLENNKFDYYDALEDKNDLVHLFDTLTKIKDSTGKHPVLTALAIPANPDFESMRKTGYQHYRYELVTEIWKRMPEYDGVKELWHTGISQRLLVPQFHGREHLNVKVLMKNLSQADPETIAAMSESSYCGITSRPFPTIDYVAAFQFTDFSENEKLKEIVVDGLNCFENVFGFRARHFAAPGAREHHTLAKALKEGGIDYLDTDMINNEHQGNGRYKRSIHFTGSVNALNQTFLVRNCVYEPSPGDNIDWINYCLDQIAIAFFWNKPAIVSTHRVNFAGHIDPAHRARGLNDLEQLLKKIVKRWPEVEFLTTNELGDLILKHS